MLAATSRRTFASLRGWTRALGPLWAALAAASAAAAGSLGVDASGMLPHGNNDGPLGAQRVGERDDEPAHWGRTPGGGGGLDEFGSAGGTVDLDENNWIVPAPASGEPIGLGPLFGDDEGLVMISAPEVGVALIDRAPPGPEFGPAAYGAGFSAVPEPATALGLLVLAPLALRGRRCS